MSTLKERTIEVALDFVNQGHLDFTVRDLAAELGVSHMAPYKQFGNKEGLLAEVASRGFEMLKEKMYAAKNSQTNEEYFTKMGLFYINFAEENPHLYRLMFGDAIPSHEDFEKLKSTGHGCFSMLVEMIMSFQRSNFIVEGNPLTLAFTTWSTVHGFSMILSQDKITEMMKDDGLKQFSNQPLKKWEKNLKEDVVKNSLRAIQR